VDTEAFEAKESMMVGPPERMQLPGGIRIVHAHVDMYNKAAELYMKAMPSKLTLFEELKLELWDYYEKKAKDPNSWWVGNKEREYHDVCSMERLWIGRFKQMTFGVTHPDTFRSELHAVLDDWCLKDNVKNHEDDINKFQKLIAVFCSQKLICRVIQPIDAYCFEQYPTFKWEEKWTHAVWKLAKESKNEH
jgi:hypothetical protein